jgi:hypothetical protein
MLVIVFIVFVFLFFCFFLILHSPPFFILLEPKPSHRYTFINI